MRQDKKLIPFGEIPESFTGLIDNGIYYTDKTSFIPYLIGQQRRICIFTRPRRFGKTLMLRTLETFFEYRLDKEGKPVDNRHYFEGLKVMEAGDLVLKEMGQYPVLSLSFKDVWGETFEDVVAQLRGAVRRACSAHERTLKESGLLSETDLELFQNYLDRKATEDSLRQSLEIMTEWLQRATGRKTVILLDEYDVPLQKAAIHDLKHPEDGLFDKTVVLIGQFISAGFKSNSNLAYGIIAGCMRVARESVFTGMNNPGVITVLDKIPDEFWGFTEAEVKRMLDYYGIGDQYPEIERWYDGYLFGGRKVFNPWSLLNAIRGLVNGDGDYAIQPYWVMTSGNDIVDDAIERNPQHREMLSRMLNGETVRVSIYKSLSYRDLKRTPETIWSFLLYTGYLNAIRILKTEEDLWEAEVAVPNTEVKSVMRASLKHWWKDIRLRAGNGEALFHALKSGEIAKAERELRLVLSDSTSYFDYNEAFYHGMLVGLLGNCALVRSNDEYGEGRPDIVALAEDTGIILEVKCVTPKALSQARQSKPDLDEEDLMDALIDLRLEEAEKQILDRKYIRAVLRNEPIACEVKAYAVCFCRKWCALREVGGH